MRMQGFTRVNYSNANENANASVEAWNGKLFIFLSLRLRLLPLRMNQRKCNWERKAKNTSSISVCHHGTIRKKMTSTSSAITEEKLGRA